MVEMKKDRQATGWNKKARGTHLLYNIEMLDFPDTRFQDYIDVVRVRGISGTDDRDGFGTRPLMPVTYE